jgi:DNA polymerase-3 subunit beta
VHTAETPEGWRLRGVATDGHRLALQDVPLPDGAKEMPSIILPRKTVHELGKLLTDPDGEVSVDLSASKIRFTLGNVVLTSKLIDGTFPDYQRVIPKNNDKSMTVNTASFISAVDRVSTLSSEKGRAVKMELANGTLTLSVHNPESGSATEEIAAEYQGDALEIGFNARYLLDIAEQLENERAVFALSDPSAPTVIEDKKDASTLYVLMPMRV